MRLTCPNCGAQYEVPDEVIPEAGRDVQCSNCSETWFQDRSTGEAPVSAAAVPMETHNAPAPPPEAEPPHDRQAEIEADAAQDGVTRDDLPEQAPQDTAPSDEALQDDPEEDKPAAPPPTAPRRRKLDPAVIDVLRQEAELEAQLRRSSAGGLESQPDLGLTDPDERPPRRERETQTQSSTLRSQNVPTLEPGADDRPHPDRMEQDDPRPAPRRDLLPDIDEINSTLRTKGDRHMSPDMHEASAKARERRGFRGGFFLVLVLGILGIVMYLRAEDIRSAAPAMAEPIDSYVAAVDQGRRWLDLQATALAGRLAPSTEAE